MRRDRLQKVLGDYYKERYGQHASRDPSSKGYLPTSLPPVPFPPTSSAHGPSLLLRRVRAPLLKDGRMVRDRVLPRQRRPEPVLLGVFPSRAVVHPGGLGLGPGSGLRRRVGRPAGEGERTCACCGGGRAREGRAEPLCGRTGRVARFSARCSGRAARRSRRGDTRETLRRTGWLSACAAEGRLSSSTVKSCRIKSLASSETVSHVRGK